MNVAEGVPSSTPQDDPWEELAENLFGTELGKEHTAPASQAAEAPAAVLDEGPAPADSGSQGQSQISAGSAPVADPGTHQPELAPVEQATEPAAPEPSAAEARTPLAAAQDSYWDALANWNWDDSDRTAGGRPSGGAGQASGASGRQTGAPSRGTPPADRGRPEHTQRAPETVGPVRQPAPEQSGASDAFGEGVVDEGPAKRAEAAPASRRPSPPPHRRPDSRSRRHDGRGRGPAREEQEQPRRRRRRRRRRPQEESAESTQPQSAAPDELVWDEQAGQEPVESSAAEPAPVAPESGIYDETGSSVRRPEAKDEKFGWDEEGDTEPEADEGVEEVVELVDETGADDDNGEQFVNYQDVPTWEEAISFLLHPEQVEADSPAGGTPPRSAPSGGDSPRQTRHYGGRKNRR